MSDGCPKCAEKMARIKKLESALRELVRVNETSAGDDEREWAGAMLAAHEALGEDETMNGTTLISIERSRHASKGFDAAHDRTHSNSDMAKAAMCYIDEAIYDLHNRDGCDVPCDWPWEARWWKPSGGKIRNLVKAGALIAAEIDRLLAEQEDEE